MTPPISKNCPRCQTSFECHANEIAACSCVHIQLQPVTRKYLANTKYACLCNKCLTELNDVAVRASETLFPTDGKSMKEGLHYYMENGLMVFTEFYHIQRGYCCENGCRHCAYGRINR